MPKLSIFLYVYVCTFKIRKWNYLDITSLGIKIPNVSLPKTIHRNKNPSPFLLNVRTYGGPKVSHLVNHPSSLHSHNINYASPYFCHVHSANSVWILVTDCSVLSRPSARDSDPPVTPENKSKKMEKPSSAGLCTDMKWDYFLMGAFSSLLNS